MSNNNILPSTTYAFQPPVNPELFSSLWITLCVTGLITMAYFFVYESSTDPKMRSFTKSLSIAAISSSLLGFGVLFLLLWAGVWL